VDHSVPPLELVRPWRTATLIASSVAALELVLLIVGGFVLLGKSLAPHSRTASSRRPAARRAVEAPATPVRPARAVVRLSRAQTGVLVLNGNGIQGAAARAAALVRARGYHVKEVGNAPRTGYARSIVMYRPGFLGDARRFGRDLGVTIVEPLDGMRPAQLRGAQMVLILGAAR
jgi:LytR cell envelope-related transcriptional attenuator